MKAPEELIIRVAGVSDSQIIALRRRSNELTGLGKLPEEIIILLFEFTQRGWDNYEYYAKSDIFHRIFCTPCADPWSSYGKMSSLSWVRLMSVCARLRDIALKSSKLWHFEGIMIPGNESWTEICAERALPCRLPPILRYSSEYARDYANKLQSEEYHLDSVIATLIKHLPKATEAHLVLPYFDDHYYTEEDIARIIEECLRQSCTCLEFLSVSTCSSEFSMYLPDGFLGGTNNSLTTLICTNLDNEYINWPDFHFPCLRNLKLTFFTYSGSYDPDSLMTFLKYTTRLEVFFFQCNDVMDPSHETMITRDDLPYLRVLHIDSSIYGARALLTILPYPSVGMDIVVQSDVCSQMGNHQEMDWDDPEVRLELQNVFTLVSEFWESALKAQRTGELCLVLLCSKSWRRIDQQIYWSSHQPWCQPDVTGTQPFCRLVAPFFGVQTPLYTTIKAVHLDKETHPLFDDNLPNDGQIPSLVNLTTMIVKELEMSGLTLLDAWMRQREAGGQPIKLLQLYLSQTEAMKEHLREMTRNLLKDGIVGYVEWV